MREAITLAVELSWLVVFLVLTVVWLAARRPAGRRWLRRFVRFPTVVWWEAEWALDGPADPAAVEAALEGLWRAVPREEASLAPPIYAVRVAAGVAGETLVTVRALGLVQAETCQEAAARVAAALAGRPGASS
jgi:hypothetical protein